MRKRIIKICGLLLAVFLLVLITGSVLAAPSDPKTNNMGNMNMNPTGPKEVPLGTTPTDPNGAGSSNLDLQMPSNSNSSSGGMKDDMMSMMDMMMGGNMNDNNSMNGGGMGMMDNMMGMMGMMGMGNMNNNNMNSGGMNGVNPAVLAQLQSSNAMIMQMLNTLSSQPNNSNVQSQLQLLNQMLTNQTSLIQMLYSASMNMGQSNMSNNSGGMSGMSMM